MGDYQQMLADELLSRIRGNSLYSARAMARDVGLSASYFCQILKGSRALTESRAFEVARRLEWPEEKTRRFVTLLRVGKASSPEARKRILDELEQKAVPGYVDLEAAYFEAISSWIHYAILELTTVEGFQPKPPWVARRLGVTSMEVELAVRRLRSLGLLRITDDKRWEKAHSSYSTPDDHPAYTAALRRFHESVLKLGRRHLWDELCDREFGSIVVPSDPAIMPKLKEKIRKFQGEMMDLMEQSPNKAVYQMSVQLFRVDKGESR